MLRLIGCVTQNHDLKLVALAALVCGFACYTATHMLSRGRVTGKGIRLIWVAAAAMAFGTGVWTTHFIGMLAFRPGMSVGFMAEGTLASLTLAIGLSFLAFGTFLGTAPAVLRVPASGFILACGIAATHYVGMSALLVPGLLRFEAGGVVISLAAGLVPSIAAFAAFRRGHRFVAAALLCLGICGLHFAGMAAVSIDAVPRHVPVASLPADLMAFAVAAAGLLVIAVGFAGSMLDQGIAARAAREARRLRQFADATFEGILFETDGVMSDANAALGRMIGEPPQAVCGRGLDAIFSAATVQRLREIGQHGVMKPVEGELIRADGTAQPVEVLRRPLAAAGRTMVLAVRDLSERRAAEQAIQHLAHHDALTGLPNRLLFRDRLGQAIAIAQRSGNGLALLSLDLDGFKAVNDMLGHQAGDRLLVQAAARLAAAVREMDTPARVGGDEFAVVQPLAAQPDAAATLAERLVAELGRPYEIDGQTVSVGASIGIALHPRDGLTPEELGQSADLALYRAKQDGRGVCRFFEPDMDRKLRERRALELDLRDAVARDEMALHYQPLLDAETMEIVGYEALLRWTHPARGAVSPTEFIPVAEECGLIGAIGRWVLDHACAEAASWPAALRIAVNLSPVQFRQADLAGMVAAILHRHGLDPSRLELEITEGVLIDDGDRALAILRRLKTLGVRIALDDFGTGYSSLSYLRRFPFDKIKIDKSFVQGLGEDEDAEAIVRSIIAMGRSLRLEVTAEGVETEDQLSRLQAERCSQVQGFLLGRPRALLRLAPEAARAPAEAAAP